MNMQLKSLRLNLRAKVLIFTLAIIVILLITSHLATNTLVASSLREQLEKRADLAVENLNEWLSAQKERIYATAQILSESEWLINDTDWNIPNWLGRDLEKSMSRGEPDMLMIENTKYEERWVYQVVDDPTRHGSALPRRAFQLPEQRWIGGLTEVLPDGDRLLLTVGVPIRNDLEVLGLLTIGTAVDLEAVQDIRYTSGSDEVSVIRDGRLLLGTVTSGFRNVVETTLQEMPDPSRSRDLRVGGIDYLTRAQPLIDAEGDITAFILIHLSDEESRKLLTGISNALNLTALGAFVVFSLISIVFSGRITNQLNRLVDYVSAFGEGRQEESVEITSKDEVGVLARAFEELRIRLRQRTAELVRSERLASMGQIAAGVAHEINNPLGIILGFTQDLLASKADDDPDTEALLVVEQETERCARVVKDLLNLARTGETHRSPLDLPSLLDKTLKLFSIHLRDKKIDLVCSYGEVPLVLGDEQQLQQVFMNVIINSIHAMENGGSLKITVGEGVELGGAKTVSVRIEDTGSGMDDEQLRQVFDPFYTTKRGSGSGLGLFIVHRLVDAHGGKVSIDSAVGKGTICNITFPAE